MTGSSLPVAGRAVRSTPYFSSAWKVSSGIRGGDLGGRRGPGESARAALPRVAPPARGQVATRRRVGQPDQQVLGGDVAVAHALGRLLGRLDGMQGVTAELGLRHGRARRRREVVDGGAGRTLTTSGSTPAAFSRATATPWRWSIRALSRWAGSTVGLPAVEAFMAAAERASWLLVVNLASKRDPFASSGPFSRQS